MPTINPPPVTGQSSRQVPLVIAAATSINGQILPQQAFAAQAGTQFYVIATSAPISIQAVRGGATGAANSFQNGQGSKVDDGFETLSVTNSNLFPVTCLIWVGFNDFINDQLILANNTLLQVAYPTNPTPASTTSIAINDLSGQPFTDINGKKWGAISRVAILVFNNDSGVSLQLQKAGSAVSNGLAIGTIYPLTPVRFDVSGNYSLSVGGGAINATVCEIYNAIAL